MAVTMRSLTVLLTLALALLSSCNSRHDTTVVVRAKSPRTVSIEVEVYDPLSNLVWEGVGVRIVEADQEWSGCICVNPYPEDWYYTDATGLTFFDSTDLAIAEVGFVEDSGDDAVIRAPYSEDQAYVTLEVWAEGFRAVRVEVELTWDDPNVFVSVPFEE